MRNYKREKLFNDMRNYLRDNKLPQQMMLPYTQNLDPRILHVLLSYLSIASVLNYLKRQGLLSINAQPHRFLHMCHQAWQVPRLIKVEVPR